MRLRRPGKRASLGEQYAYWDERLRRVGFEDAEDRRTGLLKEKSGEVSFRNFEGTPAGGGRPFTAAASRRPSVRSQIDRAAYFRMAGVFLHEHKFQSKQERRVWELHVEGASLPVTVRATRLTMYRVREIRDRLKREMLRQYR